MKKILLTLCFICIIGGAAFAGESVPWWEDGENAETNNDEEETEYLGKFYMESEFLNGDLLKISVNSENLSVPVIGVAFHLQYDFEKLTFLKYEPGNFLEIGGDPFYLVENDELAGKLVFGETLRRDDDFPLGGDKVVDFYFQILEEDEFGFEFLNGIVSSIDEVRQDLDQIEWIDFVASRDEDYEIIFDNSDQSTEGLLTLNWRFTLTAVLVFFFICCALFAKRYRKKRVGGYVNFKSSF